MLQSLRAMLSTTGQNLHGPDYWMLAGYFVLMLGVGFYFYRYMRGMKAYFTGSNTIPWWLSGVSFYMTSFSVAAFVYYPSLCYRYGWVGVTLLWVAVPATLFSVLLFAKKWRRARIDSPIEYLETRYSSLLRQLFAWQGIPVKIIDNALRLISTGVFLSVVTGVDIRASMTVAGLIILAYTFMGGLWAVMVTDFLQFVILTVAIVVLLPLSLAKVGGISGLIEKSPPGFFQLTSPEYPWAYVALAVLMYCLAWSSINWSLIVRYYCVPKERDAIKTGWLVVFLYLFGPPLMFLPAMAARQFITGIEDKQVYATLCVQLLPTGMLGLLIAGMFAATMSTLSAEFNVVANVLTNDIYKRLLHPRATERELVVVGRFMTLVAGGLILSLALMMSGGTGENLFRTMMTLFSIATAPVAVPMLLGLLWRRASNLGAILGFLVGLAAGLGIFFFFYHGLPGGRATQVLGMTWDAKAEELIVGALRLKMEVVLFGASALTTFLATVVASFLFPPNGEQQARIAAFHERLATPIGELPEDHPGSGAQQVFSPFFVVGICVLIVGLMMAAVLPWLRGTGAFGMNLGLSLLLIVVGGLVAWTSGSYRRKEHLP